MTVSLRGRSLEADFPKEEFTCLVDLAEQREDKRRGTEVKKLVGRNMADL